MLESVSGHAGLRAASFAVEILVALIKHGTYRVAPHRAGLAHHVELAVSVIFAAVPVQAPLIVEITGAEHVYGRKNIAVSAA